MFSLLPLAALGMDLVYADPCLLPHPVRGIGAIIDGVEGPARASSRPVLAGAVAVLAVVFAVYFIVRMVCALPFFGPLFAFCLAWGGLALGGLLREGAKALKRIEHGTIEEARHAVQMLVSRDVSAMEKPDLLRSLAESLSENFCDAFVAPFFWLLCLGPEGMWAYKTVSTFDSCWGYKTPKWKDLGFAAAKADDLLAYIPARIAALLLFLSGPFAGAPDAKPDFATFRAQARSMESPNAGWPMAAAALMHNATMGGPTPYDGKIVDKPLLGPENIPWTPDGIRRLMRHIRIAGIFGGVLMWGAWAMWW